MSRTSTSACTTPGSSVSGRPPQSADVPWTTAFCQRKQQAPGLTNLSRELWATCGQLVTTHPTACAHLLGQSIGAFGAAHGLCRTDVIWYGSPQWQIEACLRFE